MKKTICLSLLVASSLFADAEIDEIKAQLKQQQKITTQLEKKLDLLSKKSEQQEKAQMVQNQNKSSSFSQNAYLPDIALILNMSAVSRDVSNSDYEKYNIPGFIDNKNTEETPIPFNKNRGFNFNYAEVAMHSTVDPYFEAFANFHLHPDEFEIGEAFVQTRSLPYGLLVKAGKFKSNFGRINSKHQHSWHFDSQPIIYESLFGPDAISDPGIQVQYVAPTDTYVMVGAEALQGTNERSFGEENGNNLYVGYIKSSIDVGENLSILGGVSIAHGTNTTKNSTDVYGGDLTFRYQLGSYSSLSWQSEYLFRAKDIGTTTNRQDGLYSELIYQYNNNISSGVRYDAIMKNDTDLQSDYAGIKTDNLDRYTAMVEYKPFPMSRLRLSYTYDKTKVIKEQRRDTQEVMLSLNIAAGAHGAHSY